MSFFADWILIVVSSILAFSSYKKIIRNRYSSIAHFIVLVEFIFMCSPVLLNYIWGIPTYENISWYKSFLRSMQDSRVALIYDMYILISITALYFYGRRFDRSYAHIRERKGINFNSVINIPLINTVIIISPLLYIIVSGNLVAYLVYATSATRGVSSSGFTTTLAMLALFSIYAFCSRFFSKPVTGRRFVLLIVYSLVISWINGKRFIIALLLLIYLYYYTRSDISEKARKRIETFSPLMFLLLVLFSYYYLVVIKPLSNVSFNSVYDMLRVDFGRDDVIKYVIYEDFFNGHQILEYRGQTILSTFLTFVPRSIWPNKPYPHYMYLTSSILGTAINRLPAGTTPSWFEMCLANFSYMGFVVGILGIPWLCRWCDRISSISNQILVFVMIMVLLTQSTDAYVGFLMLIIAQLFFRSIFRGKHIRIGSKRII